MASVKSFSLLVVESGGETFRESHGLTGSRMEIFGVMEMFSMLFWLIVTRIHTIVKHNYLFKYYNLMVIFTDMFNYHQDQF